MSRFLSSLIDRTLKPAQVLQRRQPGLFEPAANAPPAHAGHLTEESAERIAVDRASVHEIHAQQDLPSSRPPRVPRSAEVAVPTARHDASATDVALDHAEPHDTAASIRELHETKVITISHEHEQPPRPNRHRERTPQSPQAGERPRHDVSGVNSVPPVLERTPALQSQASNSDHVRHVGNRQSVRSEEPRVSRPVIPKIDTASRHPSRSVARTTAATAPPAAAPAVHVTIGRLEVRAATPAATPRKAQKAPRPTLEDYLRSRSGGST